jgi:methylthioxylose transferase
VLQDRYWAGVAHNRPAAYWMWGNLAALLCSAGLLLGPVVAATLGQWRGVRPVTRDDPRHGTHVVVTLTLAAMLTIVLADLSQMSRAEVERIWLPFVPWLLVGTALLPRRWRVAGLGLQTGFALLIQHTLFTGW